MVKILGCSCKHEYQDRKYGVGMRVHNPAPKIGKDGAGKVTGFRCTVCANAKVRGGDAK